MDIKAIEDTEELRQHAHLIAAAPELLEAAFLAVEILRMTSERDGDDPYWNEGGEGFIAFMGLRDAIADVEDILIGSGDVWSVYLSWEDFSDQQNWLEEFLEV